MTAESETSSDPDLGTPIRASFSMNRGSREAIRWVAERYGMDQSDIVNLAPVLFVILAEASLNKRRKNLSQLETLVSQAAQNITSLTSIAPHLCICAEGLSHALTAILDGEKQSIAENQVTRTALGVVKDGSEGFLTRLIYHVEDLNLRDATTSPIIESLRDMAVTAGIDVDFDTKAEDGSPAHPESMLFKISGDGGQNLAASGIHCVGLVTKASSMDEFLSLRTESGSQPHSLSPFTSTLG